MPRYKYKTFKYKRLCDTYVHVFNRTSWRFELIWIEEPHSFSSSNLIVEQKQQELAFQSEMVIKSKFIIKCLISWVVLTILNR